MSQYENERENDNYENDHNNVHNETNDRNETHAETHVVAPVAATPSAQVASSINDDSDGQAFRLYMAALDRTPDSAGLANWMSVIRSGVDLDHVANGFVNSTEFQQKYGDLDDGGYVTQLYNNVLGRDPDAAGYSNWVGSLQAGATREHVLVGFSESAENQLHSAELVNGVDYQAWVG
jgi:hypothetical protein